MARSLPGIPQHKPIRPLPTGGRPSPSHPLSLTLGIPSATTIPCCCQTGVCSSPAHRTGRSFSIRTPHLARIGPKAQSSDQRSEEHTSELQSRSDLVCRLLLEKKNDRLRH